MGILDVETIRKKYSKMNDDAEWAENKHPRSKDGKFTSGASSNNGPSKNGVSNKTSSGNATAKNEKPKKHPSYQDRPETPEDLPDRYSPKPIDYEGYDYAVQYPDYKGMSVIEGRNKKNGKDTLLINGIKVIGMRPEDSPEDGIYEGWWKTMRQKDREEGADYVAQGIEAEEEDDEIKFPSSVEHLNSIDKGKLRDYIDAGNDVDIYIGHGMNGYSEKEMSAEEKKDFISKNHNLSLSSKNGKVSITQDTDEENTPNRSNYHSGKGSMSERNNPGKTIVDSNHYNKNDAMNYLRNSGDKEITYTEGNPFMQREPKSVSKKEAYEIVNKHSDLDIYEKDGKISIVRDTGSDW